MVGGLNSEEQKMGVAVYIMPGHSGRRFIKQYPDAGAPNRGGKPVVKGL